MPAASLLEVSRQHIGNDTMWTQLKKKLTLTEQDAYASLKCQCGRHSLTACVCRDINNSARGCDVICATDGRMLLTGEQEGRTDKHTHTNL